MLNHYKSFTFYEYFILLIVKLSYLIEKKTFKLNKYEHKIINYLNTYIVRNIIFYMFSCRNSYFTLLISEERRLEAEEKPLLVQLNWHKDDREGRFLLRRIDDKTNVSTNYILKFQQLEKGN